MVILQGTASITAIQDGLLAYKIYCFEKYFKSKQLILNLNKGVFSLESLESVNFNLGIHMHTHVYVHVYNHRLINVSPVSL